MSSPPTRLDQLLEIEGVDTVVDRVLGTFVRYLSFRGIPLAYQLDRGLGGYPWVWEVDAVPHLDVSWSTIAKIDDLVREVERRFMLDPEWAINEEPSL